MAAIKKLVLMDANDVDNVLDLDTALHLTADAIRVVYGELANATGKQAYATAAMADYEFKDTGFQDAVYDLIDAIVAESSGSPSNADISNIFSAAKAGSFTLSNNIASGSSYDIVHNLGSIPDVLILFTQDITPVSNWGGLQNQVITLLYRRIGSESHQVGMRLKNSGDPSTQWQSVGFTGTMNATTAQFKSSSTTSTGAALAAKDPNNNTITYYWLAAKVASGGGS